MIRLSKLPVKTLKTQPKVSDNRSTSLLLQAWFIRQEMAGVYNYLPLWLRVLRKIENIVREEMDNAGYSEILTSILWAKESWDVTNRWDMDVMFHVPAHGDREYSINPTNEETVVPLMKEFIESYKDLPMCVYHIQKKFRNEKRAKSGLLRGREFIMKDAYSFHSNNEEFVAFYEEAKKVYMRVFSRLGLGKDTVIAQADGGVFTDKFSHEFQTFLEIWEDVVYTDETTWISYNQEVTPAKVGKVFENVNEEKKPKQDVLWEWMVGVAALAKFLNIEVERTTKTMLFETDTGTVIAAAIRGDYNINEIKLRKVIWYKSLKLLSEEKVRQYTWAEVGYAGVLWLPDSVKVYFDDSCAGRVNFEMWANKTHYHSINVNFWVDVDLPEAFYDFKDAQPWDKNPDSGAVYTVRKACEVGNIFPLETKFSRPFKLAFLWEDNKMNDTILMGCYGIGVSRLMGVIAEYFVWEKGINWPENLAPAQYDIVVLWDHTDMALQVASDLEKKWFDVIVDDRGGKIGYGQKMGDAELFGIPYTIVISDKTVEKGWYELKKRGDSTSEFISF